MEQHRKRRWPDIVAWLALTALILTTIAHLVTRPPAMPAFDEVRADWQPSEAWLYDRDGQLLDSERVDFARRRLAREHEVLVTVEEGAIGGFSAQVMQ